MTQPLKKSCPFGHKCQTYTAEAGLVEQCELYTKVVMRDPQTGREEDEYRCSLAWIPILLIENANTNRGQTAAIESFRNEVCRQNYGQAAVMPELMATTHTR